MKIKGTTFAARRDWITRKYGKEAWEKFISEYAKKEPFFERKILPTSLIPADLFLKFNEAVINYFYPNKKREEVLWEMGRESAEWAFYEGPYQTFLKKRDVKDFFENTLPLLWNLYYTEGRVSEAKCQDDHCIVTIEDVPIKNDYFELTVMSFIERALELITEREVETVLKSSLIVDGIIQYEYIIK